MSHIHISTQPFSGSAGAFFWAISTKDRLTPEEVRALWLGQAQKMGLFPGLSHRPEWEWDGIPIKSLFCIFFRGKWAVKDDIWRVLFPVFPYIFRQQKAMTTTLLMDISMGASRLMGHPISKSLIQRAMIGSMVECNVSVTLGVVLSTCLVCFRVMAVQTWEPLVQIHCMKLGE